MSILSGHKDTQNNSIELNMLLIKKALPVDNIEYKNGRYFISNNLKLTMALNEPDILKGIPLTIDGSIQLWGEVEGLDIGCNEIKGKLKCKNCVFTCVSIENVLEMRNTKVTANDVTFIYAANVLECNLNIDNLITTGYIIDKHTPIRFSNGVLMMDNVRNNVMNIERYTVYRSTFDEDVKLIEMGMLVEDVLKLNFQPKHIEVYNNIRKRKVVKYKLTENGYFEEN